MSVLTKQIELALGKFKKPFGFTDCTIGVQYLDAALAEAVKLENAIILIKDKARLPLTTKSEVIEDLRQLIKEQALQESD